MEGSYYSIIVEETMVSLQKSDYSQTSIHIQEEWNLLRSLYDLVKETRFNDANIHLDSTNFHLINDSFKDIIFFCCNYVEDSNSGRKEKQKSQVETDSGDLGTAADSTGFPVDLDAVEDAFLLGFKLVFRMQQVNRPDSSLVTYLVRMLIAKGDGHLAFNLIKVFLSEEKRRKKGLAIKNKLKNGTYLPLLRFFCKNLQENDALEVKRVMESEGLELDDREHTYMLKMYVEMGDEGKVYDYLHIFRKKLRGITEETMKIVNEWFTSEAARNVMGVDGLNLQKIRSELKKNGGWWHGLGWLGRGEWVPSETHINSDGICKRCGDKLVCDFIDIGEANAVKQSLAPEDKTQTNFKDFEKWLERHDFKFVLDGANIGFVNDVIGVDASKLDGVISQVRLKTERWPLVVLSKRRIARMDQGLVQIWKGSDILFESPEEDKLSDDELPSEKRKKKKQKKSDDDWYWIYASLHLNAYFVSSDKLRNHKALHFHNECFFYRWEERFRVGTKKDMGKVEINNIPCYATIIYESEKGTWHIPLSNGEGWLCITRDELWWSEGES